MGDFGANKGIPPARTMSIPPVLRDVLWTNTLLTRLFFELSFECACYQPIALSLFSQIPDGLSLFENVELLISSKVTIVCYSMLQNANKRFKGKVGQRLIDCSRSYAGE